MVLNGQVALVTGAASGIGRACTVALLNAGAKVTACDINAAEGKSFVSSLTAQHGKDRVIFAQCDVTDYSQFEQAFETTISTFGQIDIVVNNAGIMNDRFWELEVDVNLNGVIRGTLLALKFMSTDRGYQGGIVVNVASKVSFNPYISAPIYSATKAAIVNFTRAFGDHYHVELTGVKVMAICPGETASHLVRKVSRQLLSVQYKEAWENDTANSDAQSSDHVANSIVHITSVGKSGSVWLVDKGEEPHEITFPEY